jgi:hypothetical protein
MAAVDDVEENSEKDATLAQKLSQLQPFSHGCIPTGMHLGQLAFFGPT